MKMRALELFMLLMQGCSLNAAARHIGISQPAATNLLRSMESDLGLALFLREKGRLQPTAEAERLLPEANRVLASVTSLNEAARELTDTAAGALTLAATPTIAEILMSRALAAFCRTYPAVRIWAQIMAKRQVFDAAVSGRVDLAILNEPFDAPMLATERLISASVVCFMPKNHPLTACNDIAVRDLAGCTVISHLHSSVIQEFFAGSDQVADLQRQIQMSVNHTATALRLVAAGVGVALTDPLIKDPPGLVRRAVVPRIEISPNVVYRKDRPLSRHMRFMINELKKVAREHGAKHLVGIEV